MICLTNPGIFARSLDLAAPARHRAAPRSGAGRPAAAACRGGAGCRRESPCRGSSPSGVQDSLRLAWYIPTLVCKQTHMRVRLPMTIQALPGAISPLPNAPFIPSESTPRLRPIPQGRRSRLRRLAGPPRGRPALPGALTSFFAGPSLLRASRKIFRHSSCTLRATEVRAYDDRALSVRNSYVPALCPVVKCPDLSTPPASGRWISGESVRCHEEGGREVGG